MCHPITGIYEKTLISECVLKISVFYVALLNGRLRSARLGYLLAGLFYSLQVAAYVAAEILAVVCDGLGCGK